MPHDEDDDSQTYPPRRRSSDSGMGKYLVPLLLGLTSTAAVGAFTFAWSTSRDVALLKAQQAVSPVEFARLQSEVEHLREKGREMLQAQREELERLRTWMRAHRHGGTVPPPVESPAPSP